MMNQQQDSQGSSSQFEDDKAQSGLVSPWPIQSKRRKHEGPKSEHPSTYDESIPPLSYHAQDHRQAASSSSPKAEASPEATQKTSSDGAIPKMAHRPYSQYTGGWQVPSWARQQQNNSKTIPPLVWFIIGIILFPPLLYIIINIIFPLLLLFILFVLIVMGILLLAFVIIATLWFIGRVDSIKPPFWW
jgi:hypothetical protein